MIPRSAATPLDLLRVAVQQGADRRFWRRGHARRALPVPAPVRVKMQSSATGRLYALQQAATSTKQPSEGLQPWTLACRQPPHPRRNCPHRLHHLRGSSSPCSQEARRLPGACSGPFVSWLRVAAGLSSERCEPGSNNDGRSQPRGAASRRGWRVPRGPARLERCLSLGVRRLCRESHKSL